MTKYSVFERYVTDQYELSDLGGDNIIPVSRDEFLSRFAGILAVL